MVFTAGFLGLLVVLGGAQLDLKRVRGRSLAFLGRSAARQSGETDGTRPEVPADAYSSAL
jgi:hypothetical protein